MTMTHTAPSAPCAIPPRVLSALLRALGVAADAARLSDAAAQLQGQYRPQRLVAWTRQLLVRAGLDALVPVRLPWRRFDPHQLPALVWNEAAWWVASAGAEGQVSLSAPGHADRCVPADALLGSVVLWLRPQQAATADDAVSGHAARLLWQQALADRAWIAKVVVATVVVNLLGVASSLYAMQVYDRVIPTLAYATLTTLTVGMGFVVAIDAALKWTRARIVDSLSADVDRRVSQRVFEHLLQVQADRIPRSVGTVAAQVGGLEAVRQFFSSAVLFVLVDFPFALMFLAFIAVIGGPVAVPYALVLALTLLAGWGTHRALRRLVRQQVRHAQERQGVLVEAIRGAEAIRAAHAGWTFAREWQGLTGQLTEIQLRQKLLGSRLAVGIGVLSVAAYVAAIVTGVWQVEAGAMTMGAIIACSILGGRVLAPAAQGAQLLAQWEQVSQGLAMVDRFLALAPQRPPGQVPAVPALEGEPVRLQAQALRYRYEGSPVLQVQAPPALALGAGERVLLVGPVGSGKSTLLKLLAGLYPPTHGRVQLQGVDLAGIDPQLLAVHVGYLPQEAHLFKGTLRSNLVVAGVASDEQVAQVAQALALDEIAADHPMGMERPVSEGGSGLSGGQRQLVALGRLLIAQPRVWLLDEPTASLDAQAQARVWQALAARVGPDDLLVVATHQWRLAARLATRVIVMQRGEVVRDASPREVFPRLFDADPLAGADPGRLEAVTELMPGARLV